VNAIQKYITIKGIDSDEKKTKHHLSKDCYFPGDTKNLKDMCFNRNDKGQRLQFLNAFNVDSSRGITKLRRKTD